MPHRHASPEAQAEFRKFRHCLWHHDFAQHFTQKQGKRILTKKLQSAKLSGQEKFGRVNEVVQLSRALWVTPQECAQCKFHATPIDLQTLTILTTLDDVEGKEKKAQGQGGCPGWVLVPTPWLDSLHGCQGS